MTTLSRRTSDRAARRTSCALCVGAALVVGGAGRCEAPASETVAPPEGRPRTALVLSGGGARGAAHIGVLKVLEELRVRPDLIVGTSMGAIVGGLYATGWRPEEIESFVHDLDWSDVLIDRVDRDDKSFRRKQDDQTYLVQAKLRFKGFKPYLPSGVLGGQRLEALLRSLEIVSTGESDFDRFPIPYRAVAADIETGEAVVLGRGSLGKAMRASMSIAGVFSPVEIDGRSLVDGGAAANLPVRIARSLGADRIVAVDISSPLEPQAELRSFVAILNQVSSFLTVGNRVEDVAALTEGDVLLVPDLGAITLADFKRAGEAVAIGEASAREAAGRLRDFAVDEAAWAAFRARHRRRPPESTIVGAVSIRNESALDDEVVRRCFRNPIGEPLDPDELRRSVGRLAALDVFGTIQPELRAEDGLRVLDLLVPRKPYGRNSLQFGLSLQDDFEGGGTYGLTARHVLLAANRRGGEWVNVIQLGSSSVAATEFYQPLDRAMRWFVAPAAELRGERQTIWLDGVEIADYRLESAVLRLDAGVVLGNWGEIRTGAFWGHVRGEPKVGFPTFPSLSLHEGGVAASFRVDTLDSTAFSRRGTQIVARWQRSQERLGSDADFENANLTMSKAFTTGRNTFVPGLELSWARVPPGTVRGVASLGGFLRLSGLGSREILGDDAVLGRLVYYRELTRVNFGAISPRAYVGVALEAGNVYDDGSPVTWPTLRYGGAVFVGADTLFGPAYLAWGWTEPDRHRIYLTIGERF